MGFTIRGEDGEILNELEGGDSVSVTGEITRSDGSTDRAWGDDDLDNAFDRGSPTEEEASRSSNIVENREVLPSETPDVSDTAADAAADALDAHIPSFMQQSGAMIADSATETLFDATGTDTLLDTVFQGMGRDNPFAGESTALNVDSSESFDHRSGTDKAVDELDRRWDNLSGWADHLAGSTDEAVGRTFDDEPGGGVADPDTWTSVADDLAGSTDEWVGRNTPDINVPDAPDVDLPQIDFGNLDTVFKRAAGIFSAAVWVILTVIVLAVAGGLYHRLKG